MVNPHNICLFTGRVPTHEKLAPKFTDGGDKNARYDGIIDVRRNWKRENDKYYGSDLVRFVAWGATAKYLHDYVKPGDVITIECNYRNEKKVGDDGETHYYDGFTLDSVTKIYDINGKKAEADSDDDDDDDEPAPASFSKKKKKNDSNPFANR